jgi:hypothetical protein
MIGIAWSDIGTERGAVIVSECSLPHAACVLHSHTLDVTVRSPRPTVFSNSDAEGPAMEAPSILTISLTLDCDDQQKYDDDTASDYEIFCFHWATVPPAPTSPQSRILFTENRLLPFQYHVRFWPKADMGECTVHVRFRV